MFRNDFNLFTLCFAEKSYVHLAPQKKEMETIAGADPVEFVIMVDAYPPPAYNWTFERLDGSGRRAINFEKESEKYRFW